MSTQASTIDGVGSDLLPFSTGKFLDVYIDPKNQWIYADWKGVPSVVNVKEGLETILQAIEAHNFGRLLNDNRKLRGTWTGALEWIVNDWTPRAINAGYSAVAFIYSPDVFGKFSVDALLKQTDEKGVVKQKPFGSMSEAKDWLSEN